MRSLSLLSLSLVGFRSAEAFAPILPTTTPTQQVKLQASSLPKELEDVAFPNPDLDAVQVATLCMSALKTKKPNDSLAICFNFSSDRCRAAVGGSLDEFVQYAANPTFGSLVNCEDYEIASIGPIIPGGTHRGEMQTVLMDIQKGLTVRDVLKVAQQRQRKRPTIEERMRRREREANGGAALKDKEPEDDGSRRFLWTLQKERRPPRQDCWLVHEVLFVKNAFMQTY